MKNFKTYCMVQAAVLLFTAFSAGAQTTNKKSTNMEQTELKSFLIEREIPNAGLLKPEELKSISQTSCNVLKEMGPKIQWVHSYVTGNKIYCIYKAESAELIREHAKKGGFPANSIVEIANVISPKTAEMN